MPSRKREASLTKQFADNLRRLRTERGFSQEGLSVHVGLHRTEVSTLERAQREPRMGTLLKLAGGLQVPLGDLLEGIEWQPPKPSQPKPRFRITPVKAKAESS